MTCISSTDRDDWQADLESTRAQIAAINSFLASDQGLAGGVSEFVFDSGTGRQSTKFNSPQEMIEALHRLVARRELLKRKLGGRDIMRTQTRRANGIF